MKFIGILLVLFCCHSYAAESKILPDGNTNEFQLTISNHNQPDADQPTTLRSSMAITRCSLVKKISGISALSGAVVIPFYENDVPVPVIAAAGIHVKNYLRHIYPAMHYW